MSRYDEYDFDRTAAAPGSLEVALSADPIESPVLELQIGERKAKVRFRQLSQTVRDKLYFRAIQWAEERRRQYEDGGEWRATDQELRTLRRHRMDLLVLHASMVDPDSGGPACSLDWLEKRLDPELHTYLAGKLQEFGESLSLDHVTPEAIDAFISAVKKNEGDPELLWTLFGSRIPFACALYLVSQLPSSPTEPS